MKKNVNTFKFNDSQCEVCGESAPVTKIVKVNEVGCCPDCSRILRKEVNSNERINKRIG